MSEATRVHLVIRGRVQGVNYRASTQEKSRELRLRGWVGNNADGSVEIVAEGDAEALEKLIEWCRVGPKRASVAEVKVIRLEARDDVGEFTILR